MIAIDSETGILGYQILKERPLINQFENFFFKLTEKI